MKKTADFVVKGTGDLMKTVEINIEETGDLVL